MTYLLCLVSWLSEQFRAVPASPLQGVLGPRRFLVGKLHPVTPKGLLPKGSRSYEGFSPPSLKLPDPHSKEKRFICPCRRWLCLVAGRACRFHPMKVGTERGLLPSG